MKRSLTPPPASSAQIGAAMLEAHPTATLLVGADLVLVRVNAAARRLLGAREGMKLAEAIPCVEGRAPGGCATGSRCGGCACRRCVERALEGSAARERAFVLRSGAAGDPADLHLIVFAAPFEGGGARQAIVAAEDANALLSDPGILRVCEGCGRLQDEEGRWHPLHRYIEDRLGLEPGGSLCDACEAGTRPGSPPGRAHCCAARSRSRR